MNYNTLTYKDMSMEFNAHELHFKIIKVMYFVILTLYS